MRFVPVKSEETQALLMIHKAREFLVRQQTQIVNAMRAFAGLTRPHRGPRSLLSQVNSGPAGLGSVETLHWSVSCGQARTPRQASLPKAFTMSGV